MRIGQKGAEVCIRREGYEGDWGYGIINYHGPVSAVISRRI